MTALELFELEGHGGRLAGYHWPGAAPRWIALLCHGYGEHLGRYQHVADRLVTAGADVWGVDHRGHGASAGERVSIPDYERVVDDFALVAQRAREAHPDLPMVLIGHSMGGMIAARYAQRHGDDLAAVVLSGPVIGRWDIVGELLAADEIPAVPIDPSTLSRDPWVGEAYEADPLVWHGAFRRETLLALQSCLDKINNGGRIERPLLWLHGSDDHLVPIEGSAEGWQRIAGARATARTYDGARHEIFNEINADEVLDDVISFAEPHLS